MRRTIISLALFCLIALLAAGVSAQEKKMEVEKAARTTAAPLETEPGKIGISEDILVGFVDEPDHHFGLAREYFMKKDYKKSAAEIRKAAGFVKLELARATGDDQRVLSDAVIQLAKLAEEIEGGTVSSVDKLNAEFAHTEQALAYHHELKAQEYWKAENQKKAGQDLRAASKHLENSMKYTGEKVEADTDNAIKDADDIGQKLVAGTRLAAEKVGAAIEALGKKIQDASKKMGQSKK
jgi:hypothetical protein